MNTLTIPPIIHQQVADACDVIRRHLSPTLRAIHLFGSAVDSGLKPYSDIDLLVTVDTPPMASVCRALMQGLLAVSVPLGSDNNRRALEVTVVCHDEVFPWRYPARRELQFGEWLRQDLLRGIIEPPQLDIDLAILLKKARMHNVALVGPEAATLFAPVPDRDFLHALADSLKHWNSDEDWAGDERNVVLTLARIWYSAETRQIGSKEAAAAWLRERLPQQHQAVLREAQEAYLTGRPDDLSSNSAATASFIHFATSAIAAMLASV